MRVIPAVALLTRHAVAGRPTVWRAAEEVDTLPVGAQVTLTGDELISGNRGIAFRQKRAFHIEEVREDDLPSFLFRRTPVYSAAASAHEFVLTEQTCQTGRFLLHDPRVGLFHNQRISYETALDMASALGRILVLPGFFKFPHPEAYDGLQWVPFRDLFDVSSVRSCYGRVVELEELLEVCGSEVLDQHITVPFETLWMRSKSKAPWINGTRPEMRWAWPPNRPYRPRAPREAAGVQVFSSKTSEKETKLKLEERLGHMLAAFLKEGVAEAQTIRTHGLIARNVTQGDVATCFMPSNSTMDLARSVAASLGLLPVAEKNETPKVLGIHLRLFKPSTQTSGGYMLVEHQELTESLCNFEPEVFFFIASWALARSFLGFWPSKTWMATNEADERRLIQYMSGFPGPRANPYRPHHYDQAVSVEECTMALQSVLVDAIICSWADYFIGNVCSTMSQYIQQLRLRWGKPFATNLLVGGIQHAEMLQWAREEVENGWSSRG
ncbi:unnamed protein product [Cladocopium goreaui]|uniref:GDP-fucose protein O-fucosyltransferase 1 n=1 Tax=Cladocopium goreaui TaxID=2562237 RepID=A0A9P1C917_9DINO|nr:unnamed protein product [Cladocopium goreaui]